jgi:hypothetical protein
MILNKIRRLKNILIDVSLGIVTPNVMHMFAEADLEQK